MKKYWERWSISKRRYCPRCLVVGGMDEEGGRRVGLGEGSRWDEEADKGWDCPDHGAQRW